MRDLVAGTLSPARLLAVDDHLSECSDCRERAARDPAVPAVEDLWSQLQEPGSHFTDDEVQRYVDGSLDASARARLDGHMGSCAVCAAQVQDLRAWVPAARPLPRAYFAAAAAVLLAVVGPAISWQMTRRAQGPEGLAGFRELARDQQAQVRAALAAGIADPPPLLASLAGGTEVLMGPSPSPAAFRLMSPVATAVVTDRPRFEWQPLAGASSYEVAVADERLQPVAASGDLTLTSWTPAQPLPRDRTYVWQVTARRGGQAVIVPTAPAPAARFRVLDGATVARLESLERDPAHSRLLLGIVFLEAGARDDARRHLLAVPATDPNRAVARRTLERLAR
jgi:anti-sigma factor RsiW